MNGNGLRFYGVCLCSVLGYSVVSLRNSLTAALQSNQNHPQSLLSCHSLILPYPNDLRLMHRFGGLCIQARALTARARVVLFVRVPRHTTALVVLGVVIVSSRDHIVHVRTLAARIAILMIAATHHDHLVAAAAARSFDARVTALVIDATIVRTRITTTTTTSITTTCTTCTTTSTITIVGTRRRFTTLFGHFQLVGRVRGGRPEMATTVLRMLVVVLGAIVMMPGLAATLLRPAAVVQVSLQRMVRAI